MEIYPHLLKLLIYIIKKFQFDFIMGLKESYDLLNKLGDGAFSSVFLAIHRPTGVHVAIKIIKKNNTSTTQTLSHESNKFSDILHEAEILKSLNHPNIIKLFEFFEDDNNFYFVQELCEHGTVAQYIMEYGSSEGPEIKRIFLQLISAISYLHEVAGILHCDIKAENVLLDSNNNVKLADFGFAYDQNNINENSSENSTKIKGSPAYIAPEILQGSSNSVESDIWSTGVFLYYILTGSLPFEDDEIEGLVRSIVEMKPAFPSHLSSEASQLIMKILKKNPKKRYSLKKIKNNKWCKELSNLLDESYKNLINNEKNIDANIINQMIKMDSTNFGTFESIMDDLTTEKLNDTTTSYKILLKKKENEILNNHMKFLKKKSAPQRSSDLGARQPSKRISKSKSQAYDLDDLDSGKVKRTNKILINSKGNVSKFKNPIKFLK